jgi:fumarate hydratase class II
MNDSVHPSLRDVPIGIDAGGTRCETDSMGGIDVPAHRYWGAQTQRSLIHFSIGDDRMPKHVYHAYGYVKKSAAVVNEAAGRLPKWKADAIVRAADEVIRRQSRRSLSAVRLADRVGHPVEHERQRSHLEPRDSTAWWRDR